MLKADERVKLEFATAADLSQVSYEHALSLLADREDSGVTIVVHPYAKHLAQHIAWYSGWRLPVEIDSGLSEDEWYVVGHKHIVHSAGA